MKKLLVLCIIALFIGFAFIPTYNAVSISKDIEKTNSIIDDIENDCNCQSNGKTHLAEKLLNRLEKNELISNVIDSNNQLFFLQYPIICEVLENIVNNLLNAIENINKLWEKYPNSQIIHYIWYKLVMIIFKIDEIAYAFGCDPGPHS